MRPLIDLPIAQIVARYKAGEDTCALGRAFGVNHNTIWRRLKAAGVKLRACGARPGNKHGCKRGGPLSDDGGGYSASRDRKGKQCSIHRALWEAYHGSIPKGYHVHHVDGNRRHNEIGNLACMPNSEHVRLHWRKIKQGEERCPICL